MTSFMTSSFVKFVFADSQRSCLLFPVVDYVPAEFLRLLVAFDCKPHEMVLKINISCPYCKPHLHTGYQASELHSRRSCTRAFPVNWQPRYLMMLTPLQLPSVYHNPSCDGCARDAEENRMRKKSLVDKT